MGDHNQFQVCQQEVDRKVESGRETLMKFIKKKKKKPKKKTEKRKRNFRRSSIGENYL